MIRVIRVLKELLPCVKNAFIAIQCIVMLLNLCVSVDNVNLQRVLHRYEYTTGIIGCQ